jgi:hypothetical protein
MIRIAIATLALTMIVGPMVALGLASPTIEAAADGNAGPVSQDRAVALAQSQGLARVSNIVFQDGVWILQGATSAGAHLEVDISGAGAVLNPSR